MIKFHLDEILKSHNMTINGFTQRINEHLNEKNRSISRKTITAIANNTAKNIQISALEDILDYFKLELSELISYESYENKLKVTYDIKNENFKYDLVTDNEKIPLPSIHFDITTESKEKHIRAFIHMPINEDLVQNNKIAYIFIAPTFTNLTDYLTEEEFGKNLTDDFENTSNEFQRQIKEFISMLTPRNIEFILKQPLEKIFTNILNKNTVSLFFSRVIYITFLDTSTIPVKVNIKEDNNVSLDFSSWINSNDLFEKDDHTYSSSNIENFFIEVDDSELN